MRVTTIQCDLIWESPTANRRRIDQEIEGLAGKTDLILLPEMFTTGFTMNPTNLAESMDGQTHQWMMNWANRAKAAVAGSLIIEENGRFFNRFLFVCPDGTTHHYDKRHLFTMAGEDEFYTAGTERCVFSYLDMKICLQVCYDLRFPVFSRNIDSYDLLIYVANWPTKRIQHWQSLLVARAIENQAYVVAVNRVGTDANGHEYPGSSSVIDPKGDISYQMMDREDVCTHVLDMDHLLTIRKALPFLKDRDVFQLS